MSIARKQNSFLARFILITEKTFDQSTILLYYTRVLSTILSFKDEATEDIANMIISKNSLRLLPYPLHNIAYKKLVLIDNANSLLDLVAFKSNHFEKLLGDRTNQYSIRINKKYRICFEWQNNNALNVEIVDYH